MEAFSILFPTVMIVLYVAFWKKVEQGHVFFGLFIASTGTFTIFATISRSSWEIMMIIILLSLVFVCRFLILRLIGAVSRRQQAKKLPKAIVVSFPHNHLRILGMDKIKKYIPSLAVIFFFLNLTGCDSNVDMAVFSLYTLFAVGWIAIVLAIAFAVFIPSYLVWRVVRHFRRAREKWELEKAKGELLQSLSLIENTISCDRTIWDAVLYEYARMRKERQLEKIEARLAELK